MWLLKSLIYRGTENFRKQKELERYKKVFYLNVLKVPTNLIESFNKGNDYKIENKLITLDPIPLKNEKN